VSVVHEKTTGEAPGIADLNMTDPHAPVNEDQQCHAPTHARPEPEDEDYPPPLIMRRDAASSPPGASYYGRAARTMPNARDRARAVREAARSQPGTSHVGARTMPTTRARARATRDATPTEPLAEALAQEAGNTTRLQPGSSYPAARTMATARARARAARNAACSQPGPSYPAARTMPTAPARARAARNATPYPAAPTEALAEALSQQSGEAPLSEALAEREPYIPGVGESARRRVERENALMVLAVFFPSQYMLMSSSCRSARRGHTVVGFRGHGRDQRAR
jgi:hypothetical protein